MDLDAKAVRQALPKQPTKFSSILANLSSSAAFRKGRKSADLDVKLAPEVEAHLCQLAMLENYAEHSMYVKFSDEEASILESKALNLALTESKDEDEAKRTGKPVKNGLASRSSSISSQAYTMTEAERVLAALRSEDDPLFSQVAPVLSAGRLPSVTSQGSSGSSAHREASGSLHGAGSGSVSSATAQPEPPPPRFSTFSAFKKKLLPKLARGKKQALPPVPKETIVLPPGTMGNGYSPGSYDHFAAEAAEKGMEYCNGYIFPQEYLPDQPRPADGMAALEDERMARALAISSAQASAQGQRQEDSDGDVMARAMKESRRQAEYDEVLRDAKMLRQDLGHEQERCGNKQRSLLDQKRDLDARISRLSGGKQGVPPHLTREAAEADHYAKEAGSRAAALGEAVEELGHLEEYLRTVKPPKEDALALSEVIVRQLLERLNFLGFDFHVPAASQDESAGIGQILAKYRQVNPAPPSPAPKKSPPPTPASKKLPPQTLQQGAPKSTSARTPLSGAPAAQPAPVISPIALPAVTPRSSPQSTPRGPASRQPTPPASRPPTPPVTPQIMSSGPATPPQAPSTPVKNSSPPVLSSMPPPTSQIPRPPPSAADPAASATKPKAIVTKASSRLQRMASKERKKPEKSPLSGHHSKSPSIGSASARSLDLDREPSIGRVRSLEEQQRLGGRTPSDPVNAKRSSQVVHVYNEMRKVLPQVMETYYAYPEPITAGGSSRKEASPAGKLAKDIEATEAVKADADRHARTINRLASTVSHAKPKDMTAACELVEDVETQLFSLQSELRAVLAQFPHVPLAKWDALKEAVATFTELEDMGNRMRTWALGRGTYQEEAMAMEVFFDTVRVRIDRLQSQVREAERRWAAAGIPWDGSAFRRCRLASLHIATLFMSRALFEVANLERSQVLKADACINDLADAIRIAYKVHQFVGGFHGDAIELFEKVRRLAQYYVRSRDPMWLKDTTKFS